MEPIEFKEQNIVFAKDQPPYLPLPVFKDDYGQVVTCWNLSFKERLKVMLTGKVWLCLSTFNKPLTPVFMTTKKAEVLQTT
jgi:hypothetical protein